MQSLLAKALLIFLLLLATTGHSKPVGEPFQLSREILDGERFMDIRLLGTVELFNPKINGLSADELSGLGWDNSAQRLYAITDNALLFHFKPIFKDNILVKMDLIEGHRLRNKKSKRLKGKLRDAEGLHLLRRPASTHLLISFERIPRIHEFSVTGESIRPHPLPHPLEDKSRYSSANKALEAVTYHPTLGLITAPEFPLTNTSHRRHTLYLRSPQGKTQRYHMPRYDAENSAITAISVLADGRLVILERTFSSIFTPVVVGIHVATLPLNGEALNVHTAALFDNAEGWSVDNYEGLAYLGNNRFLMVTDNNDSPLQRTLFTHFELLPPKAITH